jgi:hypothetical protein
MDLLHCLHWLHLEPTHQRVEAREDHRLGSVEADLVSTIQAYKAASTN